MPINDTLFTLANFRIDMNQHNTMLPSDVNDFEYDYERIFYLISVLQYSAIAVRHMRSYDARSLSLPLPLSTRPLLWPGPVA